MNETIKEKDFDYKGKVFYADPCNLEIIESKNIENFLDLHAPKFVPKNDYYLYCLLETAEGSTIYKIENVKGWRVDLESSAVYQSFDPSENGREQCKELFLQRLLCSYENEIQKGNKFERGGYPYTPPYPENSRKYAEEDLKRIIEERGERGWRNSL